MSKRFVAVDDESLNEALEQAGPGDEITLAYDAPNPALMFKMEAIRIAREQGIELAADFDQHVEVWRIRCSEKVPMIVSRDEACLILPDPAEELRPVTIYNKGCRPLTLKFHDGRIVCVDPGHWYSFFANEDGRPFNSD